MTVDAQFEAMKRQVRFCTYEQLQELSILVKAAMSTKEISKGNVDYELAYRGLIIPIGRLTRVTVNLFYLSSDFKNEVVSAIEFLLEWLKNSVPVQRTEIQTWFEIFSQLLIEFLQDRQIPISLQSVVRQHRSVPGLVEYYFPGYLENNLLGLLLKQPEELMDQVDETF